MKSLLRLSTRQQLALTPQIQQALRMLQLGAKELSEEIDDTLKENPLLQDSKTSPPLSSTTEDSTLWLENQPAQNIQTLENHLIQQLSYLNLGSQQYVVCCIVISSLDDDGYLRSSTSELLRVCANENILTNEQEIQDGINFIQCLDPAGIAARDLAECLKLQIKQHRPDSAISTTALRICEDLHLLANDRAELQTLMNVDDEIFDAAIKLIQHLNPSPGKEYNQKRTIYILPDIFVSKSNQQLSIQLNPQINRGIELNHQYIDLLKKSSKSSDKEYLKSNLDKAKWWMNALIQRNKTLYAVALHIIHYQSDYIDSGDATIIKPLKQQQIADALSIHISTVSRAIREKYLQTPIGVIPLKKLFARSITTDDKKMVSDQRVKSIIKNLIKNEPSQTPLSDSKIVLELKTRGIVIARRTVNKYREQLNIPASRRRKVINT